MRISAHIKRSVKSNWYIFALASNRNKILNSLNINITVVSQTPKNDTVSSKRNSHSYLFRHFINLIFRIAEISAAGTDKDVQLNIQYFTRLFDSCIGWSEAVNLQRRAELNPIRSSVLCCNTALYRVCTNFKTDFPLHSSGSLSPSKSIKVGAVSYLITGKLILTFWGSLQIG